MSLFQDSSLRVDNPQSREEDEELEEQRRRQEELTDLLAAGIHSFNYDDSTMNSSSASGDDGDTNQNASKHKNKLKYEDSGKSMLNDLSTNLSNTIEHNYKNINQQDQLKVLYEVRVREINSLKEEFGSFKEEKAKEINILKHKLTLLEAETRHLKVTLSNSESLLVEKTEMIKTLKDQVNTRDHEIEKLKQDVEEQKIEICTYKSSNNELHLKLANNNSFAVNRKLNSEELQKAHQDQLVKLETLLQEQTKKVQILEKEKKHLEEDVNKLLKGRNEIEEENNLTIMGLSKKLQNTQQQCKDLFVLGEAVKRESDHFKARLQQFELSNKLDLSEDGYSFKKMDKEALIVQAEKLKRLLLDKDVELNTLKAKLKFYDSDLTELFEYRQLLNKMYSPDSKLCSNIEHEELIIFMQRQLQSYQQAVEDRNNQILNLNSVNKDLQEKIEEMIQQTRTDIQNLSQKYSLPQLETMSKELKNAQETINHLQQQLLEKGELAKSVTELQQELQKVDEEKRSLLKQIEELGKTDSQLMEENEKVKTQIQKICLKLGLSEADIFESDSDVHNVNSLKLRYGRLHEQLQQVVVHLENTSPRKTLSINMILKLRKQVRACLSKQEMEQKGMEEMLEQWDNMLSDFIENSVHGSASIKEAELKDTVEELTNAKTMLEGEKFALEYQLKTRTYELEEARKEISVLKKESESNTLAVQKLNDQVNNLKKCLHILEENKKDLEAQLDGVQKQLNDAKEETINLHKEMSVENENTVRKNLFEELNSIENNLEGDKKNSDALAAGFQNIVGSVFSNDVFQKCLQTQLLKAEIVLRDRLQEENLKKMQKIEEQYKNVFVEKSQMYNNEKEKWRLQEANYRKQFAAVLDECGKKMQELEIDNINLIKRINSLTEEYKSFKLNASSHVEKCNKMVLESKKEIQVLNTKWSAILEQCAVNANKIAKQNKKTAKNIQKRIAFNQTQINLIENMYEEKIQKIKEAKMHK